MSTEIESIEAVAEKLADACRTGNLNAAYRILQQQPFKDLQRIALRAGFSCVRPDNRRDFMAHLVGQVAEAARRRTDGYGLRHAARPTSQAAP